MDEKQCPICGKTFTGTGKTKYCSPFCSKEGERLARKEWEDRSNYREKQRKWMQDYRQKKAEDQRKILEQENKKKAAEQKRRDTIHRKKMQKELEAAAANGDIYAQMDLAYDQGDMWTYYTLYRENLLASDREYGVRPGNHLVAGIDVYRPDFVETVMEALEESERKEAEEQ